MSDHVRKKSTRGAPRRKQIRSQILHPVTGEKWSLTARTQGDLCELVARARRIGHELRAGRTTKEDAMRDCDELAGGRIHLPRMWTVADAWRAYVETIVHPPTRQKTTSLWKILEPDVGAELVSSLTDGKLATLCAKWLRDGYSTAYVNKGLCSFLRSAIQHAKSLGKIDRIPWDSFKPPRVRRKKPVGARSLDELRAIIAIARQDDALDVRRGKLFGDLAIRVIVIALAGLRNGEGAGLGWDHVDFDANTIHVEYQAIDQWRKHWPGKTRPDFPPKNAAHVQIMHPDVRVALLDQRAVLKNIGLYRPDGPVFPRQNGDWRNNANCIYPEDAKSLAVRAGVPNAAAWMTHAFRHSMATLELLSGGAPRATQMRVGHSSIKQLEQYVHGGEGAPSAIPRLEPSEGPP